MGGYVVSVKEDEWIWNDGCTLTPAGIMILAELDKLPDNLDKNIIRARSKAIYYVDDSEYCRKGRDICSRMEQVGFELAAIFKAKKAPSGCRVLAVAVLFNRCECEPQFCVPSHVARYP